MNPDPTKTIRWGAASEVEMMDGWVEYVDALPGQRPEDTVTKNRMSQNSTTPN
jgi:hypothetical protein